MKGPTRVRIIAVLIVALVVAACTKSASTPPDPKSTPDPMQLTLQAAGTALMQSTAEVAIRETDIAATLTAIESAPTDPPPATATEEPEAVSIFADMELDDYGYEGREWAFNQGYIPGCTIEGGSPEKTYGCPDDSVPIIGMVISGVRFYHEDGKFLPPASTNRTFEDLDFDRPEMDAIATYFAVEVEDSDDNTESENVELVVVEPVAYAEELSRLERLPDWLLTIYPNIHYINPLEMTTECDAHITVQYLVHGSQVQAQLEQYIAPDDRVLEYEPGTPRMCIGAMERNIAQKIFFPGTTKEVDPLHDEVTWAYWSEILKNADAVRDQPEIATPEPTLSPTSSP